MSPILQFRKINITSSSNWLQITGLFKWKKKNTLDCIICGNLLSNFSSMWRRWGGGGLPPDGPWQAQLQGFYYMLTAHVDISTLVGESWIIMGLSNAASEQHECVTAPWPIAKGFNPVCHQFSDWNWAYCGPQTRLGALHFHMNSICSYGRACFVKPTVHNP